MKNIKLLALCLIAALMLGGCGGGSSSNIVADNKSDNQQDNLDQEQEQQEQENNEAVNRLVSNLLEIGEDGSPALFNYAPVTDSYGEGDYGAGTEEVNFVKYITSKDLDANGEFVKTIKLEKDCGYIIKYSHSGRDLGYATLGLRITTPDNREMYLDFSGKGSRTRTVSIDTYPATVKSIDQLSEDMIAQLMAEGGMTREELAAEIAVVTQSEDELPKPIYVPASLDVVPPENPCAIFYTFKAPLTGEYQFAFSENIAGVPSSLDVALEVRVYRAEESYSAGDDEEIQLTPRQIVDVQRILLNQATEFNEQGLPIAFRSDEGNAGSSGVRASDIEPGWIDKIVKEAKKESDASRNGTDAFEPEPTLTVPYDPIFVGGAGFYAQSGMRAVIDSAIRDDQYSEIVIEGEEYEEAYDYGPADGPALRTSARSRTNVIGTCEELYRAMEVDDNIDNHTMLLSNALGFTGKSGLIMLGVPNMKTVHVVYEIFESDPRPYNLRVAYVDSSMFSLKEEALALLKRDRFSFLRIFGDYFVAGYIWGMRIEVMLNVVDTLNGGSNGSNKRGDDIRDKLSRNLKRFNISINEVAHTGRSKGTSSLTLNNVTDDFKTFMSTAKSSPRSEYEQLYAYLMRYRELSEAYKYILRDLPISKEMRNLVPKLGRKIYDARSLYNSMLKIPRYHLRGDDVLKRSEFEDLVREMQNQINRICNAPNQVSIYYKKFDSLCNDYKAFTERYGFYCYFMERQANEPTHTWSSSPGGSGNYTAGFTTYDKSALVQEDLDRDTHEYYLWYDEDWNGGKGYDVFEKNYDPDKYNNRRINWYIIKWIETKGCSCDDLNGGILGRTGFHLYFKCAKSRRMEVYLGYRLMALPYSKYPFAGLK